MHHLGVKSASPTQPWQDGPQLSYSLPPHERPRPRPTQLSLSRTPELPQLCERTLAVFEKQTTNQRLDPKAWKLLRGRHGWAAVWGTGCLGSEIPPPAAATRAPSSRLETRAGSVLLTDKCLRSRSSFARVWTDSRPWRKPVPARKEPFSVRSSSLGRCLQMDSFASAADIWLQEQ